MKDEKKGYIIKQLGRTHKKNYENYCITRIFHKLDRLDVKFVTQQLFQREGENTALTDLYLPQIELMIEVDEKYHKDQKRADRIRKEEIIANKIKFFEEVIPYELKQASIDCSKSITKINQQIDELICEIKQKIDGLVAKKQFVPWKGVYPTPQDYIKKGYIHTKGKPSFRTIQEVSELFNKGYGGNKGGKTQRAYFSDQKGSNTKVWCPKLAINGIQYKVPFHNEISTDGDTIFESNINESDNDSFIDEVLNGKYKNHTTRYVFTFYRDSSGEHRYRFRGVFKLNKSKTKTENKRVWEKTSERVDLTKYKSESKKTKQGKAEQR